MMTDNVSTVSGLHKDTWYIHRVVAACLLGTACGVYLRILDFWPIGGSVLSRQLRNVFDFPGFLLLFLVTFFSVFIWFVSAIIASFRRRFRLAASNIAAITLVYGCLWATMVVPIFDPWFWYVLINESRFEAVVAANNAAENSPRFAIIEERDVSTGITGASINHLVTLIYDESDVADAAPSDSDQKHLYGHFYRRDTY
ncbi:hypothetical protein [Rhizobium sp. CF142]|uniref:hypothetical protein n=1 Tax=Rhizobium sp. CF142 TaxID=1144314 RepID=UPI00026EEB99|nr:hypothetical protein [Rhizobium sp. CF142]EJJ29041.1 hypothetical protein PMI11_02643 [Rhizobium sp. CF142]